MSDLIQTFINFGEQSVIIKKTSEIGSFYAIILKNAPNKQKVSILPVIDTIGLHRNCEFYIIYNFEQFWLSEKPKNCFPYF